MRRDSRKRNDEEKSLSDKIIMYSAIGVGILAVIVIALIIYSKNLSDNVQNSTLSLEEMARIAENSTQNTQSASSRNRKNSKSIGK